MPHRRARRRAVVCALFASLTAGCVKWRPEAGGPAALAESRPNHLRVETRDGAVVELVRPEFHGDTITGLQPGSAPPGAPLRRVSIPYDQVERVGSKRGDARRIFAAAVAAPIAFLVGGFLMDW